MSVVDVAKQSEVLIISVPMKAIQQFQANLFDGARHDLIVVDTGNYYSIRDGRIEPLESGVPERSGSPSIAGRFQVLGSRRSHPAGQRDPIWSWSLRMG